MNNGIFLAKSVTKKLDHNIHTKVSPLNMAFPKPAFPSGVANSARNAKKKPYKILMNQMKWNL